MKISNTSSSSVLFESDDVKMLFPTNSLFVISNDDSELINVRLKGSRKNILTFNYNDIVNISASSANDAIVKINNLINK